MFGPEFNMTHKLAITLQQTMRIGNLSATKEPNIHVSREHIYVAERRIIHTGSRMTVMQYLSNVFSAGTHDLKPAPRDRTQLTGMFVHPELDPRISLNRTWKSHKAHGEKFVQPNHFFSIASRFGLNSFPGFHSGNLSPLATS